MEKPKETESRPPGSWLKQIIIPRKIGDEPPLNTKGFWKKPKQGLSEEEFLGNGKGK